MSVTPFRKPEGYAGDQSDLAVDNAHMGFNGHTVFKRTDAGNTEFRNRASLLPQRLKSILLLVDSRTTVDKFVASLRVYGDVSDLFQVLLDMGFIEPMEGTAPKQIPANHASVADSIQVAVQRESRPLRFEDEFGPPTVAQDAAVQFAQHKTHAPAYQPSSYLPSNDPYARPAVAASAPAPFNPAAARDPSPTLQRLSGAPTNNDLVLRRAVNMLTDWVPELFPNDALDIQFELDKCRTREEFALTMNDLLPVMQKVWGANDTRRRISELQMILAGKL